MPSLFPTEAPVGFARVAVERGMDQHPDGLTYAVPRSLSALQAGDRVLVPLGRGNRLTAGYVLEIEAGPGADLDPETLKLIERRDEAALRLPSGLMELARWISSYYAAPLGVTLTAMLPAAVKRHVGRVDRTYVDRGDPAPPDAKLTPKQRAVLAVLAELEDRDRPVEMHDLARRAGLATAGPIRRLQDRGLVATVRRTTVEAAWQVHAVDATAPTELSPGQTRVVAAIGSRLDDGFSTHLLFGVTGSGKTEVYIRLIREVLARGRTALLLVPEISLTPQTGGRLLGRFPDARVAILHSGLTAAQRHQQWAMAASGAASIVLGARSAIFAPVADDRLGLIVVDEEHDGSYKQDQAPRYHGRDVALRRGQLAGCPVVLGSATPSLESWLNATERARATLHRLPERVPGMLLPTVRVVDLAAERRARHDRRMHLLGPVLEDALHRVLAAGAQALLLLNRRGYASYITCRDPGCGWVMTCDDCDVTMVYHRSDRLPAGGFVRCHHCLAEQRLPRACPDCTGKIGTFGLGTQRVEEELSRKFPVLVAGRTLRRVDSDTMRSVRDFHDVLGRFGRGEHRVLVGTQMIAKGLDYPGVRLVGVINADTAINLPDFRASERTFQLVNQVAGRSGRSRTSTTPGLVVVQSLNPDVPAIRLAAAHDYPRFAAMELESRRACGLPPFARMARIVIRDADHEAATRAATLVADALTRLADGAVAVRGPAPCPIARIAGRHRRQVELVAPDAGTLQALLATARNRGVIRSGVSMAIDVDPIALL